MLENLLKSVCKSRIISSALISGALASSSLAHAELTHSGAKEVQILPSPSVLNPDLSNPKKGGKSGFFSIDFVFGVDAHLGNIGLTYFRKTAEGGIEKEDLTAAFARGYLGLKTWMATPLPFLRLSTGATLGTAQFSDDLYSKYDAAHDERYNHIGRWQPPPPEGGYPPHGFELESGNSYYYLEIPVGVGIVLNHFERGIDAYTLLEFGSGLDFMLTEPQDMTFVHYDNTSEVRTDKLPRKTEVKLKHKSHKIYPPFSVGLTLDLEWAEIRVYYKYQKITIDFESGDRKVEMDSSLPPHIFGFQAAVQYRF